MAIEHIGRKLYQARMMAGARAGKLIPRKVVADAVGITEQTLMNWEHGLTKVDLAAAQRLANFYGVTLDELAGHSPAVTH